MHQQVIAMLELQDSMNTKVNASWREQNYAWYRAIWVECAELLDHYGWKWWKKQTPDMEQIKLELVDIWHFGLSILLLQQDDSDAIAEDVDLVFQQAMEQNDFKESLEKFTLNTLHTRRFDLYGFRQMMVDIGLSFDELYKGYVGKNVLNFFRQDHGYQDGSYRKLWNGKEDNEHLVEAVAELDASDTDFPKKLYQNLQNRYG